MKRKFISIAVLVVITLAFWIFWSTNANVNGTLVILKRNHFIAKNALIKPSSLMCKADPLFLIILVTSYVGHVELRSAHRRAMPLNLLKKINAARIFLLAQIPENERFITKEALKDESDTFNDILQGSFIEHYRNLTYKHMMGLQWASTECNKASFILKVDDDTVFNLERTYKLLKEIDHPDVFMGYMLNNTKPKRNKENKWYVTYEEYARQEYPPYLSGWYYITTPRIAAMLCDEAIYHPYFWIDDIFVSGLLTESLKIELKQLPKNFWLEYYELLECCLSDMIKKSLKCDYVIGPNGSRNNLIVEFNEAIRNCDLWANCTNRTPGQVLNKNCVAFMERSIFSDGGQAEVHFVKL